MTTYKLTRPARIWYDAGIVVLIGVSLASLILPIFHVNGINSPLVSLFQNLLNIVLTNLCLYLYLQIPILIHIDDDDIIAASVLSQRKVSVYDIDKIIQLHKPGLILGIIDTIFIMKVANQAFIFVYQFSRFDDMLAQLRELNPRISFVQTSLLR